MEVGRDVRPVAAVDAADPAGAHEPDPGRAAGGERSADRRRADRALDDRRGEVARADLARVRGEALELGVREADAERSVEDSDRRRNRSRVSRTRCADSIPTATPSPAGKPCATSVVSSATTGARRRSASADLGRDLDHGIAPSCDDAARSSLRGQLRPADEKARRERVARAGRVDDLRRPAPGDPRRRRVNPPAPRLSTRRPGTSPPIAASSLSFAKTRSGPSSSSRFSSFSAPYSAIPAAEARSMLIRPPCAWIAPAAFAAASSIGRRRSEYPERCSHSQPGEPAHVELLGAEERRHPAVGEHRPASVSGHERHDHAVPALLDRAEQLDTARRDLPRRQLGRRVGAALADEPSLGSERSSPGRDVRRLAARADARLRRPLRFGPAAPTRPDDDVQEQVAECAEAHRGIVSGGLVECGHGRRRSQVRAPSLASRRRRDRSLGRDRDREAQASGTQPRAASARVGPGSVRRRSLLPGDDRA